MDVVCRVFLGWVGGGVRGEGERRRRGEEEKGREGVGERRRRGEEEKGREGVGERRRRGEEEKGRGGEGERGSRKTVWDTHQDAYQWSGFAQKRSPGSRFSHHFF
ncbi:MAG: hypothetical protein O3C67_01560 [Cyanobacteria bacterium]|nr:hypothetical protein [Cyanobacteriota bacterium]